MTDFTKWHILAITIKLLNARSELHSRHYTVAILLQMVPQIIYTMAVQCAKVFQAVHALLDGQNAVF